MSFVRAEGGIDDRTQTTSDAMHFVVNFAEIIGTGSHVIRAMRQQLQRDALRNNTRLWR